MDMEGRDNICQYLFMALTHGLPALVRMGVYKHTQPMSNDSKAPLPLILTKKLQLLSRANFQIVSLSFFSYVIKRNFRMMSRTQMKAKFDVLKC